MKDPQSSKFSAEKLEILSFKTLSENTDIPEVFDPTLISKYETKFETKLSYNLEKELIRSQYTVSLITESKNKEEAKRGFDFVFIFGYHPLKDLYSKDEGKTKIDLNLGISISAITHSTVRGILMMKLQDDIFANYILPIIKPALPERG